MNRQEAIEAMKAGKKVKHTSFTDDEWVTIENGKILFEDGVKCNPFLFWLDRQHENFNEGWSLFSASSLNENSRLTPDIIQTLEFALNFYNKYYHRGDKALIKKTSDWLTSEKNKL